MFITNAITGELKNFSHVIQELNIFLLVFIPNFKREGSREQYFFRFKTALIIPKNEGESRTDAS